jgi:hypothetical protein
MTIMVHRPIRKYVDRHPYKLMIEATENIVTALPRRTHEFQSREQRDRFLADTRREGLFKPLYAVNPKIAA